MEYAIQREKLDQAVGILDEQQVDCWLTFARETSETPDPAMQLIVGQDVTWQSAFLVTRAGRRIAIVGGPDGAAMRRSDLFDTVLTFDQGIAPVLRKTVAELA